MSEAEIITKMRAAIEVLKQKLQEAECPWLTLEFLGAAMDKEHWMHTVTEAERLSEPYHNKADSQ